MGVEDYITKEVADMADPQDQDNRSDWKNVFFCKVPRSARRDLFAAAALQGLVNLAGRDIEREATLAVLYADALIAALDQPKGET